MDRFIRYAAYAANALLLLAVMFFLTEAYGSDVYLVILLAIPPLLSIKALRQGPDIEESRLIREVNKAELRKKLTDLGVPKKDVEAASKPKGNKK